MLNKVAEVLISEYGLAGILLMVIGVVVWYFYKDLQSGKNYREKILDKKRKMVDNHLNHIESNTEKAVDQHKKIQKQNKKQLKVLEEIRDEIK